MTYVETADLRVRVVTAPICGFCGLTPPVNETIWYSRGRELLCSDQCIKWRTALDLMIQVQASLYALSAPGVKGIPPAPPIVDTVEWEHQRLVLIEILESLSKAVEETRART